ncbi:MAG: hypothetical protein M3O71_30690 [Bacteroidota bacterium]|nr:hypothetical protein [Bacteroidota bacterium]
MIAYLVNSTLCSALLLAVYHLLLKNKTMYNFNRAYLLFGILFSLAVPFIVVKHTVVKLPSIQQTIEPELLLIDVADAPVDVNNQSLSADSRAANHHTNYLVYTAATVYSLVSLLLLVRFISNLNRIRLSVKQNGYVNFKKSKLVLVDENLTPHTFLNYIFLNKQEYESNKIEADVLRHEQTHASELHSADIIFMELVLCLCWFNPLIWFYRTTIQLNHEFIADAAVLNGNNNISEYQQLLLSKLDYMKSLSITSQFNYSITKNRLIMMSKSTPTLTAALSRLAVIPVLAFAFTFFCAKTKAQQTPAAPKQNAKTKALDTSTAFKTALPAKVVKFPPPVIWTKFPHTKDGVSADLLNEYAALTTKCIDSTHKPVMRYGHITAADKQRMEDIFRQMSSEQQMHQSIGFSYSAPPPPPASPTDAQLASWKNAAEYGVWINDKKSKNTDLESYKAKDFDNFFVSKLYGAARAHVKYHYQVNLMTVDYYKKFRIEAAENRNKAYMYYRSIKPASLEN